MLGFFSKIRCFHSGQASEIPEGEDFLKIQSANSKKIDREIERDRQISQRGYEHINIGTGCYYSVKIEFVQFREPVFSKIYENYYTVTHSFKRMNYLHLS